MKTWLYLLRFSEEVFAIGSSILLLCLIDNFKYVFQFLFLKGTNQDVICVFKNSIVVSALIIVASSF